MECQCTKPKIYHVTEIKEGEVVELHLCEDCIKKYIQNDPIEEVPAIPEPTQEITQEDVIKDLLKAFQMIVGKPTDFSQQKVVEKEPCHKCGLTLAEISKLGRLGCPECYDHFGPELKNFLNSNHGALEHVGKVPSKFKAKKELTNKFIPIEVVIKGLEAKMHKAVRVEKYEEAAKLRDAIKELNQLNTNLDLLKIEYENKILNGGNAESIREKMVKLMEEVMAIEEPFT